MSELWYQLPRRGLLDNFGPTSGQQARSVPPFGLWETRRRGDVPQFTSLPGFPPAFTSAQSFSASDLTFNEMESMSENDFECFTSMGVKSPLKAMFLMQIGIIADLGIAPRNARRSSASMVSLLGDLACGPENGLRGDPPDPPVISSKRTSGPE